MDKFVVIQSNVGEGTWRRQEKNLQNLFNNELIPSVKDYCYRHKYDHYVFSHRIKILEQLRNKYPNHGDDAYFFHNILSLLEIKDNDFDYVLFLDADFHIRKDAKPLPETNTIMIYDCPHYKDLSYRSKPLFEKVWDPNFDFTILYGCMYLMTKDLALKLAYHVKDRIKRNLIKNTNFIINDEIVIAEWMKNENIQAEYFNNYFKLGQRNPFWHIGGKEKYKSWLNGKQDR